MATRHPFAFFLCVSSEYGTRRFRAIAGVATRDGFRTPTYSSIDASTVLDGFEVTATLDPTRERADCFSHHYAPFQVELHRAQAMARMLSKVQRGLAVAQRSFGYPETFHTYLVQVAYGLGITRYVTAADGTEPFLNGSAFRDHTASTIADWIATQEATYCRPGG